MTERDQIIAQVLAAVPGLSALLALGVIVVGMMWLRPVLAGVTRLGSAVEGIVEDWQGEPERRDASGAVVQPGRPGLPARIKSIEEQLRVDYVTLHHDVATLTQGQADLAAGQAAMSSDITALAADFGTFKRRYQRDLEYNHPDYTPTTPPTLD